MSESEASAVKRWLRRWPIRLTLYQMFAIFSIVAAVLLLRRVERQQVEYRTKRTTLFSLNRDLYVDDLDRMAGVQRCQIDPNELSWSLFIPKDARGQLIVEGQVVAELAGGMHRIRAMLHRTSEYSSPLELTAEKLLVDDVAYKVSFPVNFILDDPGVTEPSTANLGEQLPLLTTPQDVPGSKPQVQMWVEAKKN